MKRILLRDVPSEIRLRHAMWNRAQGVPAEERVRHCLRAYGRVAQRGLKFLGCILLFLWFAALVRTASLANKEWLMFFISLIVSGWLVVRLGRSLLLPRDGLVLAHTPISNRRVLTYECLSLVFPMLLLLTGAWSFYRPYYSPSLVGFVVMGWMLVPFLALAWQSLRGGRSGPFLLWGGVFGLVSFLFLMWLEHVMPRLIPFEELVAKAGWLPSNWLFTGMGGSLLAGGSLSFSVLAIRRAIRQFRLRATPGAQVRFVAVESDKETSPDTAVEPPRSEEGRGPNLVTKTCQLFWNEEERLLGEAMLLGYSRAKFWQWTAFLAFLFMFWWLPRFVHFEDPVIGRGLSVVGPLVATIVLMLIWQNVVLKTAFAKFPLPGERFVALAASLPVSEKLLFRMYLKEVLVGFLLLVPMQMLFLWMIFGRVRLQVNAFDWLLILLVLCGFRVLKKVGAWTGALWESMAFFQPGFRGEFKTSFCRIIFFLPIILMCFVFVGDLGRWLVAREFPNKAVLFLAGGLLWVCGGCWLLRWFYGKGKGSMVVPKAKRKSFRLS